MLILGGTLIGLALCTAMQMQGGFTSDHWGVHWHFSVRGACGWIRFAAATGQSPTAALFGQALAQPSPVVAERKGKKREKSKKQKPDRQLWVKAMLKSAPQVIRIFFRQIHWVSGRVALHGGFIDPALTGQLWGIGAVLSAMDRPRFQLHWQPDFQQSSICIDIEGTLQFRPVALLGWGLQSAWMIWREFRRSQRKTRRFPWSLKHW